MKDSVAMLALPLEKRRIKPNTVNSTSLGDLDTDPKSFHKSCTKACSFAGAPMDLGRGESLKRNTPPTESVTPKRFGKPPKSITYADIPVKKPEKRKKKIDKPAMDSRVSPDKRKSGVLKQMMAKFV